MKERKKPDKARRIFLIVWLAVIAVLIAAILIIGLPRKNDESLREVMRDGVLHESNKIALFGSTVNPGLISAFVVTGVLLVAALLIRLIAVPRFKTVPGKFQALLEKGVDLFSGMARNNSPHKTGFIAAYIFSAGTYIFFGTLFEMFGIQAVTTE